MLDFTTTLTYADGTTGLMRIPIGDVCRTHEGTADPWSAAVEIHGLATPEITRLRGRDWTEAIEDAVKFTAIRVADKVKAAGGGTLDAPLLARTCTVGSCGVTCRIADDGIDAGRT